MTDSEKVVKNIQLLIANFDPALYAKMLRQTAVILDDNTAPTQQEYDAALVEYNKIQQRDAGLTTSGVTQQIDGKIALTPFEEACLSSPS